MNKPQLVKELAARLDTTQVNAEVFLEAYYGVLHDFFSGEFTDEEGGLCTTFRLGTIGTLKVADRASRRIRNIQTGEIMQSEAHKTITFKPSAGMKDALNGELVAA